MRASELRVMLVEDHPVLRDILVDFINALPQVASCTASASAEAALTSLQDRHREMPDLMLIDLALPGMNGIEFIRALREEHPDLPCAILSGHRSKAYASRALAAGALAYMLKGDPHEIERGLQAILIGEPYVSRSVREEH